MHTEQRLQRMFPRWRVQAKSVDFGNMTEYGFTDTGFPMRRFGVSALGADHDARAIGGRFLRQAYPRGWATP